MDYDVIDPAPFTSDLFFYLDLGSPEIQVPDCMSLETPSDLLEVTPTSSGGTTSSTSNNTEDASSSRSISRDVTEETSGTAPINLQLPAGSESTSDSNSASNGEGEGVDSPHLSEENNEPHEQGKSCSSYCLSQLTWCSNTVSSHVSFTYLPLISFCRYGFMAFLVNVVFLDSSHTRFT